MRSWCIAFTLLVACENCPDRSVPLELSGTVTRGTASTVTVAFPGPVFVEPSPAREADVSIELVGPNGSSSPIRATWRGEDGRLEDPFERVVVLDDTRIEIELAFQPTDAVGSYELAIIGDRAGACLGANGTALFELR